MTAEHLIRILNIFPGIRTEKGFVPGKGCPKQFKQVCIHNSACLYGAMTEDTLNRSNITKGDLHFALDHYTCTGANKQRTAVEIELHSKGY